jgi:hypothetical protein
MMRIPDRGENVAALQRALNEHGAKLTADGIFGPATDAALRAFQRQAGLVADGIAGPKTLAALAAKDTGKLLRQADLEKAAQDLGVELAAVMAINEVESRGSGFLPDERVVILFERHIMRRRLVHHGINPAPWQLAYPDVVNTAAGGYQGNAREWPRIGLAWSIHPDAAIESASWGLFQIMGFHWERLGYTSASAFMDAMRESEGRQLDAFVRFIKAEPGLHRALQRLDWPTVARLYNGPAFAKNAYDKRMQAAYDRHSAALEASP